MYNRKKLLLTEKIHHDRQAKYYAIRKESDYIWEVPEELFLINNFSFYKKLVVIDMGCGPSTTIKHLIPKKTLSKIAYIGVDISRQMLKIAKLNVPSGKFICGDIETISFPKGYADIILSLGALHHSLNKKKTIDNWAKIIKLNGYILLREPTYDALKRGEGESPMEEGIIMSELYKYIIENKLKVIREIHFSSRAFHLFNKVLIKIGLGNWRSVKLFWYPITLIDAFFSTYFSFIPIFKGLSFAMKLQKVS